MYLLAKYYVFLPQVNESSQMLFTAFICYSNYDINNLHLIHQVANIYVVNLFINTFWLLKKKKSIAAIRLFLNKDLLNYVYTEN